MSDEKSMTEYIEEYVEEYELRGDSGDYYPTKQEKFLIKDVIFGLIEEEEFVNRFKQDATKNIRQAWESIDEATLKKLSYDERLTVLKYVLREIKKDLGIK